MSFARKSSLLENERKVIMANFFEKLLCPFSAGALDQMKKVKEELRESLAILQDKVQYCMRNIQDLHLRADKLEIAKEDSTFSVETKTTYDPEKENPVVTGVTLDQSCVEFFTDLVERQYKDDKLIRAQRRFTNRLLRILYYSMDSFNCEDIKKAEKWNKVLRKRLIEHNRRSK